MELDSAERPVAGAHGTFFILGVIIGVIVGGLGTFATMTLLWAWRVFSHG